VAVLPQWLLDCVLPPWLLSADPGGDQPLHALRAPDAGGALKGVWYDNSAAEPTAASAAQIGAEAVKAAGHFGNTTAASNRHAQ